MSSDLLPIAKFNDVINKDLICITDTMSRLNFKPPTIGNMSDILISNGNGGVYWENHNIVSGHAWSFYHDSTVTNLSPIIVLQGNIISLPNNGLASDTVNTYEPTGANFVDTTTGKITPRQVGESYVLGIRLTLKSSSPTGACDLDLDIGGGVIVHLGVITFPKGNGVSHRYDKTTSIYVSSLFLTNGGVVKLTSIVGNTTIEDVAFMINRTFTP